MLEAERRALEHLLERLEDDSLELGAIAFGEGTWPIAEPGLAPNALRERLVRFRQERPMGAGRTDLICALWLARSWLEDTPRVCDERVDGPAYGRPVGRRSTPLR